MAAQCHKAQPAMSAIAHLPSRVHARPFSTVAPRVRRAACSTGRRVPQLPMSGSDWMDLPESQPMPEDAPIFPRLRERDPYRLLGLEPDASFEEVQDARNFLYEQYKAHAPSREAIELALDTILQQHMKLRHKFGFQPPRRGRKTDVVGERHQSLWDQFLNLLEPSVHSSVLINDGSILLAFAGWAGWQGMTGEPTLPVAAGLAFSAWRLYDKRVRRNPEGPFLGNNAVFGAGLTVVAAAAIGGVLAYLIASYAPLFPAHWGTQGPFAFLTLLFVGFVALCFK